VAILLAEDNRVNQLVAQAMVKKMGYACEVVENGADAVAGVVTGRFSMVLMDCQMPEMDGYEATRRIRELDGQMSRIPIVAMTANAMEGDRQRCLEAGMDDYVSKPIDPTEFKKAVRKALMSDVARAGEQDRAEIVGDAESLDSNGLS
jgi:CheY-like chemotaxis protein